jgi:tetratricopeptide (TPR) repeat protein
MYSEDERVDSIIRRSRELKDAGRDEDNLRLLREGVERFPIDPALCVWAASSFAAAGSEAEEALELLGRAVSVAPMDAGVLTRAATVAWGLNRVDELRDYLDRANRVASDDFVLAVDLVHLEGCLALLEERLEDAERLLRAAFEAEPSVVGNGQVLGKLYLEQGRVDEALAVAAEALEHLPGDVGALGVRMDAYVRLIGGGKDEDGAHENDPGYPEDELAATIEQAQAHYEEGRLDEYMQVLLAATERFPLDVNLATRLTGALVEDDQPERAMQQLKRTVDLDPADPWNLLNCADLAYVIGDLESAATFLRQAARLAPDVWERAPHVVTLAGTLAARRADDETAERYLRNAFELVPGGAAYGRDLAVFLLESGRPADALDVLAKAERLSPSDDELTGLRARVLATFQG